MVYYVPKTLKPRPPLLIALHGSMGSSQQMREFTGYEFERLADQHGFIVAYPDGYKGNWNDCRATATYPAKRLNIDDVGLVRNMRSYFQSRYDVDPDRIFVIGYSNGAHLAFRLALESSGLVSAIAAVAANLPTEDNFDCNRSGNATPMLLINGTEDPINPFSGGKVTLFGFGNRGTVMSTHESVLSFSKLLGATAGDTVTTNVTSTSGTVTIERQDWFANGRRSICLYSIHGGGHTFPQQNYRFPRILGPTAPFDAPEEIWDFFMSTTASSQ